MIHEYEASYPKVEIARARNKCRSCGGAIVNEEKYLMFWLRDLCKHSIGRNRFGGYHVKVKLCKKCSAMVLEPKVKEGKISMRSKHKERSEEALRELLGVSRYDIALNRDPIEKAFIMLEGDI
jgi:hypothetical protein